MLINRLFVGTAKYSAIILLFTSALLGQNGSVDSDLVAHEWGTFTSIAGNSGRAVEWLPLNSPGVVNELPNFVERQWTSLKAALPATIRMETPVLYFYSRQPVTLDVRVRFAQGIITEWYPHAAAPAGQAAYEQVRRYSQRDTAGSIAWVVTLQPGSHASLARDTADDGNRYYSARDTSSTPLRAGGVKGGQYEKFLFYRGVSLYSVPLTARFTAEGKLAVGSTLTDAIPNVIWFRRRGDQVGYRIGGEFTGQTVMDPPEMTSTIDALRGDLEEMLVSHGLFREEAHAMIQTWRDSWFEEGSRLFYIVPPSFVNTILPLSIAPAPAEMTRVFVGRLELISPDTKKAVAAALSAKNDAALEKYGRFLQPILDSLKESTASTSGPKLPGTGITQPK
ncbi:MAG TPA: hypothetical protein VKW06_06305 [Candidatus Angelobacter sp.]|nr:hypothetical protein [Candidatus Angelobacter sp.]